MQQTFRDLIAVNKRNTVLLVLGFIVFIAVVGVVFSLAIYVLMDPNAAIEASLSRALGIGAIVAVGALFVSLISFFEGANFVLAVNGCQPLQKHDDPELFNVVEEMAIAAGVPMPQIYLMNDSAPNAFATGRDPQHAIVAVTTGLREKLTRDELQGVIAHEMSHVRNYDIRLMLFMAVLVGTVVMLADFFQQMLFNIRRRPNYDTNTSSDNRSDSKGAGVFVVVIIIAAAIFAILAPLIARMIQFAVSRQREYLADASAVELTRNPQGLSDALRKIDEDPEDLEGANRGTAHLFIANPIKKFQSWADSVFASHPPMKDRIARIDALLKGRV